TVLLTRSAKSTSVTLSLGPAALSRFKVAVEDGLRMDGGQTRAPDFRTTAKSPPGMSASALDKRLNLRKRAREDAARNFPRQDAADLSPAELSVIEVVAAERTRVDQARAVAKA